jgi:hypothetical protein
MMKIIANLSAGSIMVNGAIYNITNKIRTVRDGTRKTSDVARSIPADLPYDPQPFPKGIWNVTGVEWRDAPGKNPFSYYTYYTYGPVKIRTSAWQFIKVWELDEDGDYLRETKQQVKDFGYLLHYSESSTTLGCIRLASHADAVQIARVIEKLLAAGEEIILEVV